MMISRRNAKNTPNGREQISISAERAAFIANLERPEFGVGFGRSNGYVHRPSYVRDWAPARFSLR